MNRIMGRGVAIAALGSMVFFVSACGGTKQAPPAAEQVDHQAMGHESPTTKPTEAHGTTVTMEEPLKSVYEHYLAIQVGLGNDAIEGLADHAKMIASAVAEDKTGVLPKSLADDANAVVAAVDIKAARAGFSKLSASLIELVESQKVTNSGLMLVHCPMIPDSWLQSGERVHNPYAGAKMMTCGEMMKKF